MPRSNIPSTATAIPAPATEPAAQGSRKPGPFAQLCINVRLDLGRTQAQLGQWFGVSGKTFQRWEDERTVPSKLERVGIVAAFAEHAPQYVEEVCNVLGLPDPRSSTAPAAAAVTPPEVAKVALDGAIFEAAERLGVPSARVREIAVLLFERAAVVGVGVTEAASMVRGATAESKGPTMKGQRATTGGTEGRDTP